MAKKSNLDNLRSFADLTTEERREIARRAGTASSEARRNKRNPKQAAKFVLELQPDLSPKLRQDLIKMGLSEDEVPDIRLIAALSIAQKAMNGDLKASKMLLEMSGDIDARTQLEKERLKLERERLEYERLRNNVPTSESYPQVIIQSDGGIEIHD